MDCSQVQQLSLVSTLGMVNMHTEATATCGDRCIDHMLVSAGYEPAVRGFSAVESFRKAHKYLVADLVIRPRQIQVYAPRQLKLIPVPDKKASYSYEPEGLASLLERCLSCT